MIVKMQRRLISAVGVLFYIIGKAIQMLTSFISLHRVIISLQRFIICIKELFLALRISTYCKLANVIKIIKS
jgi:hypothetical protein